MTKKKASKRRAGQPSMQAPASEVQPDPEPRPAVVRTLLIRLPFAVVHQNSSRHVDAQLPAREAVAFAKVLRGLQLIDAQLPSGRAVERGADCLRWIAEAIAAAIDSATADDTEPGPPRAGDRQPEHGGST